MLPVSTAGDSSQALSALATVLLSVPPVGPWKPPYEADGP